MKKILILIIIIALGFGVYWYVNQNKKTDTRCEEGFRFVPSTQTCQSVTEPTQTGTLDFSKIKIKTISNKEIPLIKEGDTSKYTGLFEDKDNSILEYVSLHSDQAVIYSDEFAFVPYIYNSGGTGQFVYIGLFEINTNTHIDSIVLGDRISVDKIEIVDNKAKVNFKDRLLTESFAETPTIPTQFVFEVRDKKITPIMQLQNADYGDVEIKSPIAHTDVSNTLVVKGAIPGSWYFEANGHLRILNSSYQEIAIGNFQALSDWMTTQRVPFEFTTSTASLNYTGNATIIIESENVQGDEEGERLVKRIYIPIVIK